MLGAAVISVLLAAAPLAAAQAASPAAVLTACGFSVSDFSAGSSNSSTSIPSYPQLLPWASANLPNPSAGQVYTLHWIQEGSCEPREVARAYSGAVNGPVWEGVRPKPVEPNCAASPCTVDANVGPTLDSGAVNPAKGAYVLDGFVRATGALNNAEVVARFLTQASFGPTMADINAILALHPGGPLSPTAAADDTDSRHIEAWIAQQRGLSPSFLRSYLRERVSTRERGDEAVVGRLSRPCDLKARWQHFAFNRFDEQSILKVERVGTAQATCYYSLFLKDDVAATHVKFTFDGENCSQTPTPAQFRYYRICGVHEQPDFRDPAYVRVTGPFADAASVVDCTGATTHDLPIPDISFETTDAATTQVYNPGEVTLTPVEAVAGTVVVTANTGACVGPMKKVMSFIGVPDASQGNAVVFYRLDRRRTLVDNTLVSPASINDPTWSAACASVEPTFVNAKSCKLVSSAQTACSTPTYLDGTSFVLNDANIRFWYTDSVRYVYYVRNLRLDAPFVRAPCRASTISRWIRTPGACTGTVWSEQAPVDAIRAGKSGNNNPDIIDVTVSNFGTCPETSSTIGSQVEVDGDCWKHSHPNEHDVYDFTQWYSEHEGGPSKIAKWAENGDVNLNFPVSHPMVRWEDNFRIQRNGPHPRLGRYGDTVEFSALPPQLQTSAMASRVGASLAPNTNGFLACGSRGEGASDAQLGHRFVGTNYRRAQGLDRDYYKHIMGSTYVWNNQALKAPDQLCHRVAWVLSQIVVARGDDFLDGNPEPMLAFYDIFLQHCHGNYRDVLREVSASPIMARYLTFHGNRAFAVTGTFPDENYAREVMQLFSIGVFLLEDDGLESRDAQGNFKLSYTNTDIENGARVWTGWYNRARRGNLVQMSRTEQNYVDPLFLRVDYRDRFPKTAVDGGYLGDRYPLCADLPANHFLRQGARYVLTGAASALGAFYDGIAGQNASIAKDVFQPTTGGLFTALCAASATECTFPGEVSLPATVACTGAECQLDTVRAVRIVSNAGVVGYYKYVEPACVYMAFFENGRIIKNSNWEQCAAEDVALSAGVTCCDSSDISTVLSSAASGECKYLAEPMRFSTAQGRCTTAHGAPGTVCPANSWVLKNQFPLRDGYIAQQPSIPAGTRVIKNGPAHVNGELSGVTRWRFRINVTAQDHTGLTGPVVIAGKRPDGSEREFVVDRIQLFAYQTNYFYFAAFATQALYDKLGAAALADFNALFPDGTEFRLARFDVGSDPTGEKGTHARWGQFCAAWQYQWTTDSCETTAEIDAEGKVLLVDRRGSLTGSYGHLRYLREGSGNKFYVNWNTPAGTVPSGNPDFPQVVGAGCNVVGCTNRSSTCICPVSVQSTAVYTAVSGTTVEAAAVVRSKLRVGAFDPSVAGSGYTLCTLGAPCSAANVAVWTKSGASPASFDTDTVFALSDRAGLPTQYLKNVESTVVLGTVATDEVQVPVTTCNASSVLNNDGRYVCGSATDGNLNSQWITQSEGVGGWIELRFGAPKQLTGFSFANRCGSNDRSRGLRLTFSDSSTQSVVLANNTKCALEHFALASVTTTFVRIEVTSVYEDLNNGAREIQFFGPAGPNGLSDQKLFNFRNLPNFVPNTGATGRTTPDSSPRYALYDWEYHTEKALDETHALLESLLQHPNTPAMIALQFIQKLVTSNPSPRYVRAVAGAFKSGTYVHASATTGSGVYGDLSATVAAVLLDREARVTSLDLDRHHGKVNEPLLKVMHMMRSMEYTARPGVDTGLQQLGPKLGQGAFQHPSVFSFFSPFYEPPGPAQDAGLVAPEIEIFTAPQLIGYLNGMDSLIEYGLTSCNWGFGDTQDSRGKRDYCRSTKLDQTDDGRLTYALPTNLNDVELTPTTCTASSQPSLTTSQSCYSALDGSASTEWISYRDQADAWFEAEFSGAVQIDTFKMQNRCPSSLRNQDIALVFSDGTNMTFTLPDNCTLWTFPLGSAKTTTSVRIAVLSVYSQSTTNTYNGAREIEFWNGATQVVPSACSASSENNARRSNTCTMNIGSTPYAGWVVQGTGAGSWVQRDFARLENVGRVQFADRCGRERPENVLLAFSDGSSQVVTMENDCDPLPVPIAPVSTTFVRATVQSTYNATVSDCCACGRFWRREMSSAASVVCEQYMPGQDQEVRFWEPRDTDAVMDAMGTLLTPGRFSGFSRAVIGEAYLRERTQEDAFKRALRLFMMAPAFHVNNDPSPTMVERPPVTPVPSQNRPYKAIITIMLAGGADSYSLLNPHTCSPVDLYAQYGAYRGPDLTQAKSTMRTIDTGFDSHPQPCSTFGLHSSLSFLQSSYNAGECMVFANMGALTEPIKDYDDYRRGGKQRPVGNFGHNGMQRNAMSLVADDHLAKGVLGRSMGILSASPHSFKSSLYSTASHKKILEGSITPSIIQAGSGVVRYANLAKVAKDVDAIHKRKMNSVFGETVSNIIGESIVTTETLGVLLGNKQLVTNETLFNSGGSLGRQLREVAKLIKIDNDDLNVERSGFIVQQGGYDTHGTFDLVPLLDQLDDAIAKFVGEMKAQGIYDNVAIQVISDFARTLTSNSQGTDHAWGGNYFLLGGKVRGGRILGSYPDSFGTGTPLDLGRGRLIATTPWEAVWNGLLEWMDIPASDVPYVLPKASNFPPGSLYTEEDLFGARPPVPTTGEDEAGSSSGVLTGDSLGLIIGIIAAVVVIGILVALGVVFRKKLPFGGGESGHEMADFGGGDE